MVDEKVAQRVVAVLGRLEKARVDLQGGPIPEVADLAGVFEMLGALQDRIGRGELESTSMVDGLLAEGRSAAQQLALILDRLLVETDEDHLGWGLVDGPGEEVV